MSFAALGAQHNVPPGFSCLIDPVPVLAHAGPDGFTLTNEIRFGYTRRSIDRAALLLDAPLPKR